MAYVIDRARAIRLADLIAVLDSHRRQSRSRMVFRDNSLYDTLTRTKTFARRAHQGADEQRGWPAHP